jgi:hypothetical protein
MRAGGTSSVLRAWHYSAVISAEVVSFFKIEQRLHARERQKTKRRPALGSSVAWGGGLSGPRPCLACLKLSLTELLRINMRRLRGLCWALRTHGSINSLRSTWTSQLPQLSPVQWAFGAQRFYTGWRVNRLALPSPSGLLGNHSSCVKMTSWYIGASLRCNGMPIAARWESSFIFKSSVARGADDPQTDTDRHSVFTLPCPFVGKTKDTRILTILNSGDDEKSQFGGLSVQGHETKNKKCTQVTPSHHGRRIQVCSALESISKVCVIS